jgi:hypothetical protein
MPWEQIRTQRFLTVDFITKKRLNAPVVWLKPQSAVPSAEDAISEPEKLDTDLNTWGETNENNLAVRLVDGYIELQIQAPDEVWLGFLFKAFRGDARAAFGPSKKPISSIILKIDGPIDRWRALWPRGHVDKAGRWVETKFAYSAMPTARSKAIWHDSKPLPGSIFGQDLVVWRPNGKPATDNPELGLDDLEARLLASSSMETIVRAIAFATLAYWINIYLDGLEDWDASLTHIIGGWIARLVREGQDINARGKSLDGVCWSPIDSASTASELLQFMGELGATKALGVAFLHAEGALERNSQAPVPGWGSIETLFGPQARVGIRRAFRAGLDIDLIEQMSERYVFDTSTHTYFDRDDLLKGTPYEHKRDVLIERYEPKVVFINGKPRNPFRLYAASSLRADVQRCDFYPGQEPAAVLRYSPVHGLVSGDDRHPDEYQMLNTFPGFTIKPIGMIDPAIMARALTLFDTMLGLLCMDNSEQILWLKKWLAWIVQYPAIKQQSCPVLIGGQGIGKSRFGSVFMKKMFGALAGLDRMAKDDKFLITPFLGKLITFVDEARMESVQTINNIKDIIRSDIVNGQRKYGHQQDFYVPSRVILASNLPDIGLTSEDAADRTFFFITSWNAENKRMTDNEFLKWSYGLKPFYNEWEQALESVVFRQHLMRYFTDLKVTREELEDLTLSSRNDASVVQSTMSKARKIARAIVADARVLAGNDITAWFNASNVRDAIKRHDDARNKVESYQVIEDWKRCGVLEQLGLDLYHFKWGYGRLLQRLGEAHNLPLPGNWPVEPGDDWGVNPVASIHGAPSWRGNKQRKPFSQSYDPDYMPPE